MRDKLLVWLVAASLAVNVYSLTQLERLAQQVGHVEQETGRINGRINIVDSRLSGLGGNLRQMREEAKWIVSEEFRPGRENSTPEEIHLDLEWAFREVEQGAKVYLLYRPQSGEWTKVPAENLGGATYRAPLVLSPREQYQYQVVAEGTTFRAGEIADIPSHYYRPAPVVPEIGVSNVTGGLKNLEVTVFQPVLPVFDFFRVKEARVKVYEGEWKKPGVLENRQLVKVVELEPVGKGVGRPVPEKGFSGRIDIHFDRGEPVLVLEVEYGDGTVQEGEIWPEKKWQSRR